MAKLTAAARKALPKGDFAVPGGHYPIPDKSHAKAALSMVSRFGSAHEKALVRAAVHHRYPGIKVGGK